ncbi:hypothetical protein QR680_018549 [Steinernema hermaphroditum]|uniref:C-type lectin domain-containing protein n=1 Tax=Steinernema hermaphroditum TaxID=289476 RepID=A0AA39HJ54_9BILA|nr:hypothetical protein QR680_018549 [Steinernema hermaphroditum]
MRMIWSLLLISSLLAISFGFECNSCPPGWVDFDCKCYRTFQNPLTWMEAEDSCAAHGAHLVSIRDESDSEFLLVLANSTILGRIVWTGAFRREYEKHFHWTDGTEWIYPQKVPDHPGDVDICLAISYHRESWKSLICSSRHPYICQKHSGFE